MIERPCLGDDQSRGDYNWLEVGGDELHMATSYRAGRQNVPCTTERFRILHVTAFETALQYCLDAANMPLTQRLMIICATF